MAKGDYSSQVVHLKAALFPPEFEDVYCARDQSPNECDNDEKVMSAGVDRRQRIIGDVSGNTQWQKGGFPNIGLIRVNFGGGYYTGTASLIAGGKLLLTCAHNLVEYDRIESKFLFPTSAWFDIRENNLGIGSVRKRRYDVTKFAIYPKYLECPYSDSGFDIALCSIDVPEDDHTVEELYSKYADCIPVCNPVLNHQTKQVAVVGFPDEHNGEKWGMIADIPDGERKNWECPYRSDGLFKELLLYNFIDTSKGQSGSPIMVGPGNLRIVGVHTGGSSITMKNWGTYINPDKLAWIKSPEWFNF